MVILPLANEYRLSDVSGIEKSGAFWPPLLWHFQGRFLVAKAFSRMVPGCNSIINLRSGRDYSWEAIYDGLGDSNPHSGTISHSHGTQFREQCFVSRTVTNFFLQ
jgi:hypothetical protein